MKVYVVGETPFSITDSSWPGGVGERLLSAEGESGRVQVGCFFLRDNWIFMKN